jgi:fatty acid desaturase
MDQQGSTCMKNQSNTFVINNSFYQTSSHLINNSKAGINPRESMLALPSFFQPFLTWLTAKAGSTESYKNRSCRYQVITTFISIILGTSISISALKHSGWFLCLLPFSLIVTTSGFRKLQVMIFHNCVHGLIFQKGYQNYLLGEFISIFMLLKTFSNYKKEHLMHHSSKKLLTFEDDTIQYLFNFIGFAPGMKKSQLWLTLFSSFISPFCYLRGIIGRISVCLFSHSSIHNIIAITYWSLLLYFVYLFGVWQYFLIAWFVPLFILYQISATLRLIVEHTWPDEENMSTRGKEFICLSTSAIFLGEAVPSTEGFFKKIVAWSWWTIKMIVVHLFSRVFVLVGDTPCHDLHHRRPSSKRWYNYIHERQQDENKGCPGYPINYSETWGLFVAINRNFECLSHLKTR